MKSLSSTRVVAALLPCFGLAVTSPVFALSLPDAFTELGEEDRHALERVAREPEQTRRLALEAALHPEVLVEMQLLQARSSAAYRERIAPLEREDQEAIWEIAREPGLLHELASGDEKSSEELQRIARRRPEALRESILRVGERHRGVLGQLDAVAQGADQEFEWLIADLSPDTREVFRELVDHPELLTLLATQVRLTVALGDDYRADPEGTLARLAALSEEVAQRDAQEEADWAEAVARDPEAIADLEEAAQVYAEENGVDYGERTSAAVETHVHVTIHPYPYWFGYPYWCAYYDGYPWGYWYPIPIHFGFYYHPIHHGFVSFGLPSFHFVYWYTHEWIGHARHRDVHRRQGRFYSYLERHPHMRRLRLHVKRHRTATHAREAWARPRPQAEAHVTRTHSRFFERSLEARPSRHRDQTAKRSSSRASQPTRIVRQRGGGEGAKELRRGSSRRELRAPTPVAGADRVRGEPAPRQREKGLRPQGRTNRPSRAVEPPRQERRSLQKMQRDRDRTPQSRVKPAPSDRHPSVERPSRHTPRQEARPVPRHGSRQRGPTSRRKSRLPEAAAE